MSHSHAAWFEGGITQVCLADKAAAPGNSVGYPLPIRPPTLMLPKRLLV